MIDKNKKLVVLMPPKTASNSIRVTLEQNGYSFSKDSKHPKYPQIHLRLSEIVDFYDIHNIQDYKIIQVTRNPYHRYVSSFFFQKKIVPPNFHIEFMKYNLDEFSEHLIKSKNSDNFVESFYGSSDYVNYTINNGMSWGGTRFYDKQTDWNDLGMDVKYFKLEDIIEDVSALKTYLGLSINNLPLVNSQGLTIDYKSLITLKVKEIILELFDKDFTTLGYSK